MLTADEIRCLIVCRLEALDGSCNNFHRNHVRGQVRALVAVLTGVSPPAYGGVAGVLRDAGIPFTAHPDGPVEYDDAWLRANGFVVRPGPSAHEDAIHHPRFAPW